MRSTHEVVGEIFLYVILDLVIKGINEDEHKIKRHRYNIYYRKYCIFLHRGLIEKDWAMELCLWNSDFLSLF